MTTALPRSISSVSSPAWPTHPAGVPHPSREGDSLSRSWVSFALGAGFAPLAPFPLAVRLLDRICFFPFRLAHPPQETYRDRHNNHISVVNRTSSPTNH